MFHQFLTAPEAIATPSTACRFKVEVASNELELDRNGNAVPARYKTLDVVVADPTIEAIATLLKAAGFLDGWGIVDHWIPEDGCPF